MNHKLYAQLGYRSVYIPRATEEYDGYLEHVFLNDKYIGKYYYYDYYDQIDRFTNICKNYILEIRKKKFEKI